MLVLTRRPGEAIVIDGGISVTVVAVVGGRVRLGFTAPASIRIDRAEVHAGRLAADRPETHVPERGDTYAACSE
jgi:carbon storage regulator